MMRATATSSLVIAVEPDPGTRRLFRLISDPLEVRLQTTEALDSGIIRQMLSDMERELRSGEDGKSPPPRDPASEAGDGIMEGFLSLIAENA